jgi:hypothetical protein
MCKGEFLSTNNIKRKGEFVLIIKQEEPQVRIFCGKTPP